MSRQSFHWVVQGVGTSVSECRKLKIITLSTRSLWPSVLRTRLQSQPLQLHVASSILAKEHGGLETGRREVFFLCVRLTQPPFKVEGNGSMDVHISFVYMIYQMIFDNWSPGKLYEDETMTCIYLHIRETARVRTYWNFSKCYRRKSM